MSKEVKVSTGQETGTAKISRKKWLIIDVVLFVVLLVIDQMTKIWAISRLKGQSAIVLWDGVLELNYLENRGSAFGMLQNQKFFILFVGCIFMAAILFFLIKLPNEKKFRMTHILLSMVVAGGIGNMIDRIRFDFVVDFISFVLINFPIFNGADCFIVIGTLSLFVLFMFVYKEQDLEFLSFKQNKYREIK